MLEGKVIGVFAKRGAGKSTLVRSLIRQESRLIVYDYMHEYTGGALDYLPGQRFRYLARLAGKARGNVELLAGLAMDAGNCLIVLEEVDRYAEVNKPLPEPLSELVEQGRHKGAGVLFVTRRPSRVHRDLTAQCDAMLIGPMTEPRDIAYFREYIGESADELPKLEKFRFLVWTPEGVSSRMNVDIRAGDLA